MMGIVEKYTKATRSSNLKSDEAHFDTDALAAVALSSDMGSLLFRVKYAFDATSYRRLEEEWRYYVKVKAVVNEWPVHVSEKSVADVVLGHWLNDRCRPCGGKGHLELVPRVLSDDPCPHCEGTGKRELHCNGRIKRHAMEMLDVIERLTLRAGGDAMAKLADEMDL